jgi:FkbM family methyltransferase
MQLSGAELEIYDWLQDDLSKTVFRLRKEATSWEAACGTHGWSQICESAYYQNELGGMRFCPLVAMKEFLADSAFIIYGAGQACEWMFNELWPPAWNIFKNCLAIWDKNPDKTGSLKHGIPITKVPDSGEPGARYQNIKVVITVLDDHAISEITEHLNKIGIPIENIILYKYFVTYHNEAQYFDKDIILPRLSEDEVFVDAGCYNFFTSSVLIRNLQKKRLTVKKIYAFEPVKDQVKTIEQYAQRDGVLERLHLVNAALWSEKAQLGFRIDSNDVTCSHLSVDDSAEKVACLPLTDAVTDGDRVTFIKMDIEGAELEALKGAREIIVRDRPKLAISIYHNREDYVEISAYIKSLVPEYKAYMRQYSANPIETVLYCVT